MKPLWIRTIHLLLLLWLIRMVLQTLYRLLFAQIDSFQNFSIHQKNITFLILLTNLLYCDEFRQKRKRYPKNNYVSKRIEKYHILQVIWNFVVFYAYADISYIFTYILAVYISMGILIDSKILAEETWAQT